MSVYKYLVPFITDGLNLKALVHDARDVTDAKALMMSELVFDKIFEIRFWDGKEEYDLEVNAPN
jgi:hypothetical protein